MAVFSLCYHMEKGGEGGHWEFLFWKDKTLSPFIKAPLSCCWETEILNNILWTEKELWDWKTRCITPRSIRSLYKKYKFVVGRLHTGRKNRVGRLEDPEALAAALCTTKMGTGRFNRNKTETSIWLSSKKHVCTDWNWDFFPPPTGVSWPLTSVLEKGTLPVFISDKGKGKNRWGTYRVWAHSLFSYIEKWVVGLWV